MTAEVNDRRRISARLTIAGCVLAALLLVGGCAMTMGALARATSEASAARELMQSDMAVLDEASYVRSVLHQRKSELRRRTLRLFETPERVGAEAAVLRYVSDAAALASLNRHSLQVESDDPKKHTVMVRVVASFDYEGEYPQVIEYLRLLQAPITEIETLRIVPVQQQLQHGARSRLSVSGKVAFYGILSPVQGGA
jgi:hypothetical protein